MNADLRKSAAQRAYEIASNGNSKALQYVLEVLCLSWFEGYSRSEAQKEIASRHDISKETVMDSFSERRGGVIQSEFDRFLEEPDLKGLEQALLMRFKDDPRASSPIRGLMREVRQFERAPVFTAVLRQHLSTLDPKRIEALLSSLSSSESPKDER